MFFSKLIKFLIILTIIPNFFYTQKSPNRYSIDSPRSKQKKTFTIISIKPLPKEIRKQQKNLRKKRKEEARRAKYEKKMIEYYWKTYNSNKDVGTNKTVYKRMLKNKKKAERIRKNKPPETIFERGIKIKMPKISLRNLNLLWKKKKSRYD